MSSNSPNVRARNLQRLREQMSSVDELTLVVLKGQLLLEEQVVRILESFVFHPERLTAVNLTFAQKVAVVRSLSLDSDASPMWDLILSVNVLRNDLAHSLSSAKRRARMDTLKTRYFEEVPEDRDSHEEWEDPEIVLFAVGLALGFLGSFEEEVLRFKDWVGKLDRIANPHRQTTNPPKRR